MVCPQEAYHGRIKVRVGNGRGGAAHGRYPAARWADGATPTVRAGRPGTSPRPTLRLRAWGTALLNTGGLRQPRACSARCGAPGSGGGGAAGGAEGGVEAAVAACRRRHQEAVALLDEAADVAGVDVRMAADDVVLLADAQDVAHGLGDDGVLVLARVAEVLRQVALADQHDADAGHFLQDAR